MVGVLNRNWRSYVATIQEDTPEGGSFHLAVPLDSAIPKIRIRYHDVKLIQNQRIVVRIDSWPVSSQYPNGHYVRTLGNRVFFTYHPLICLLIYHLSGPVHQLDTEIAAILVEHGISVSQASQGFSEGSLKEMPIDTPELPWKPEQVMPVTKQYLHYYAQFYAAKEELARRKDLRSLTVFRYMLIIIA